MPMYRKKPVVIEAIEWTGENIDEIAAFLGWRNFSYDKQHGLRIHTLEGAHDATVTDQIIKGVKGEFYPCKADIFAATYDPASPTHTVSDMGVDAVERVARAMWDASSLQSWDDDDQRPGACRITPHDRQVYRDHARAAIAALAADNPDTQGGRVPDRFANDAAAKALYDSWSDQPGWVPWVERGNSDMQEKARRDVIGTLTAVDDGLGNDWFGDQDRARTALNQESR